MKGPGDAEAEALEDGAAAASRLGQRAWRAPRVGSTHEMAWAGFFRGGGFAWGDGAADEMEEQRRRWRRPGPRLSRWPDVVQPPTAWMERRRRRRTPWPRRSSGTECCRRPPPPTAWVRPGQRRVVGGQAPPDGAAWQGTAAAPFEAAWRRAAAHLRRRRQGRRTPWPRLRGSGGAAGGRATRWGGAVHRLDGTQGWRRGPLPCPLRRQGGVRPPPGQSDDGEAGGGGCFTQGDAVGYCGSPLGGPRPRLSG